MQLAERDTLTGLANRSHLNRALGLAVSDESWHRPGRILLFIDLDHFKAVNDEHGHAAGDAVLVAIADRLRQTLRTDDTIVRLGGDEFVVLFAPIVTIELGMQIAHRIVAAINQDIVIKGQPVHVGASIGLAISHFNQDPEELVAAADLAAYEAKRKGRNTVTNGESICRVHGWAESAVVEEGIRPVTRLHK